MTHLPPHKVHVHRNDSYGGWSRSSSDRESIQPLVSEILLDTGHSGAPEILRDLVFLQCLVSEILLDTGHSGAPEILDPVRLYAPEAQRDSGYSGGSSYQRPHGPLTATGVCYHLGAIHINPLCTEKLVREHQQHEDTIRINLQYPGGSKDSKIANERWTNPTLTPNRPDDEGLREECHAVSAKECERLKQQAAKVEVTDPGRQREDDKAEYLRVTKLEAEQASQRRSAKVKQMAECSALKQQMDEYKNVIASSVQVLNRKCNLPDGYNMDTRPKEVPPRPSIQEQTETRQAENPVVMSQVYSIKAHGLAIMQQALEEANAQRQRQALSRVKSNDTEHDHQRSSTQKFELDAPDVRARNQQQLPRRGRFGDYKTSNLHNQVVYKGRSKEGQQPPGGKQHRRYFGGSCGCLNSRLTAHRCSLPCNRFMCLSTPDPPSGPSYAASGHLVSLSHHYKGQGLIQRVEPVSNMR